MPERSTLQSRRTSRKNDDHFLPSLSPTSSILSPLSPTKKPVDIGLRLGNFDTDDVREKVRKWQTQGGGVVAAQDIGAADETGRAEGTNAGIKERTTDKQPPSGGTSGYWARSEQLDDKTLRSPNNTRNARLGDDLRNASAPRKRVVSDEHWKKDRPSPAGSPAAPEKASPKVKLADEGIRERGGRGEPTSAEDYAPRTSAAKLNDDGIRVSSTVGRKRSENGQWREDEQGKLQQPGKSYGTRNGRESTKLPNSRSPRVMAKDIVGTSRDKGRRGEQDSEASSAGSEDSRGKRTPYWTISRRSPEDVLSEVPSKVRRGSRKSYGSSADEAAAQHSFDLKLNAAPVLGTRIEAWLQGAPDPFVTPKPMSPKDSSRDSLSNIQATYKMFKDVTPNNSKSKDDFTDPALKKMSPACAKEDRQVHLENKYAPVSIFDNAPSPSNPSLKRSGARRDPHSPVRRKREPAEEDDIPLVHEDTITPTRSFMDGATCEPSAVDLKNNPSSRVTKRPFPSTGKRLSTIASVETFASKQQTSEFSSLPSTPGGTLPPLGILEERSENVDAFDSNKVYASSAPRRSLKRKLTNHVDLISVLSMPTGEDSKTIKSARSIRSNRSRLSTATMADIMDELASNEAKYMRELRTLVDGVIPVLLTCVLSKSDSAVAAGLFSPSAKDDLSVTRPVIDMGIALERLKSVHIKIPLQKPAAFLLWAQGAQRLYADYLKAWRLGFQDVVVNLAPAEDAPASKKDAVLDEGLPRDANGDVVNGYGERVDVAFLLKRPLVRLKYLAKTIKGIQHLQPSEHAEKLAVAYQNLVIDARRRSNDERARLEDEAAARVDPTRARDPRTLAPLTGVLVDPTRCVRARDYFNLRLDHSSGQQLDCRVELLLRDDQPAHGSGGDILICEVDSTGRWLLFPPQQLGRVSARHRDVDGEIIVTMRGFDSGGREWSESISLVSENELAGSEWLQMLGGTPMPLGPADQLVGSGQEKAQVCGSDPGQSGETEQAPPAKSRTPSPREVQVPIGEQALETSKKWSQDSPSRNDRPSLSPPSPRTQNRLQKTRRSKQSPTVTPAEDIRHSDSPGSRQSPPQKHDPGPRGHGTGSLDDVTSHQPDDRYHSYKAGSSQSGGNRGLPSVNGEPPWSPVASTVSGSSKEFRVWFPTSEQNSDESSDEQSPKSGNALKRPSAPRRTSSVPSDELPTINKIRGTRQPSTPVRAQPEKSNAILRKAVPASAPAKLQKTLPDDRATPPYNPPRTLPPTPTSHATKPVVNTDGSPRVQFAVPAAGKRVQRRSSSPLKHEYEPSTATESSPESAQSSDGDRRSHSSESSDDEAPNDMDIVAPLPPLNVLPKSAKPPSPSSLASQSISPSQSASQGAYRSVSHPLSKPGKSIASVFAWSDTGQWKPLHPDECSIVITPGLISAYEMSAAHSRPISSSSDANLGDPNKDLPSERPLVALELTPLVPLRRGTALDISIRSPSTFNSKFRQDQNIMFRSRNPDECEALYKMINQARIYNPTYIALQKARGPGESSWAAAMDRQNALRGNATGSWWRLGSRQSSYRASSTRTPSMAGLTDGSAGTVNSAFSALRRFSTGSKLFNLGRSTITSKTGSRSSATVDSFSSSSGDASGGDGGAPAILDLAQDAPLGVSNRDIRLYERETASKWRDMGAARLSIMHPPRSSGAAAAAAAGAGKAAAGAGGQERRIVVTGKTKGERLLDVTLGESCFERVARTGIAVSVWEEARGEDGRVGTVGKTGGVAACRVRVFMIQMRSEAETAYMFSLVGKLRY